MANGHYPQNFYMPQQQPHTNGNSTQYAPVGQPPNVPVAAPMLGSTQLAAPPAAPVIPNTSRQAWADYLERLEPSLVAPLAAVLGSQALSVTPSSFFGEPKELRDELLELILKRDDVPTWPAMIFAKRVREKGEQVWRDMPSTSSSDSSSGDK